MLFRRRAVGGSGAPRRFGAIGLRWHGSCQISKPAVNHRLKSPATRVERPQMGRVIGSPLEPGESMKVLPRILVLFSLCAVLASGCRIVSGQIFAHHNLPNPFTVNSTGFDVFSVDLN